MAGKRAKTSRRSQRSRCRSAQAAPKARKLQHGRSSAAAKKAAQAGGEEGRCEDGAARSVPQPASRSRDVVQVVEGALDEMKAVNVRVLDVHKLTDIADTMIIASGNSDRHVRSIADRVVEHAKKAGFRPMGVEGERDGEWVLVDLQDVIVHIMLPRVREFYRLESLWDVSAARREAASEC